MCQNPSASFQLRTASLTDKPYIRTNPAVLQKIKQIATATRGHAGPAKIYKEAVLAASSDDVRGCPRDMKQVVQPKYIYGCDGHMSWG